jgi:hypothetical protein
MYGTRGAKKSENLENKLVTTYRRFGAKLIEAHGRFATENENNISWKVPKNTVIILLAKPGRCMFIGAGRILAEQYFRSNNKIVNFFRGEAAKTGLHHGEILSRTFFEDEMCPSVSLDFKDEKHPSFGYAWKLPLTRTRTVSGTNLTREPPPLRSEIYNQINHGSSLLLKTVVDRLGKGVYIVNACLPPANFKSSNTLGTNAPKAGWEGEMPRGPTGTRERFRYAPYINRQHRPPRPGTRRKTHIPPVNNYKIRQPKLLARPLMRLEELLYKLSRNPNINLGKHFGNLRANVNTNRLLNVQRVLKNSNNFVSKLGVGGQIRWRLARNKAKFIYNRLRENKL